MKVGGGYEIGDEFKFTIQSVEYKYIVSGFFENIMMGSFNGGLISVLLEQEAYDNLEREADIEGVLFSVKLKDRADDEAFYNDIGGTLDNKAQDTVFHSSYYSSAKSARTTTTSMVAAIFIGVSLLITAIALVITVFRISNGIDENMTSYGALKAIGYTGRQIIMSLVLQVFIDCRGFCSGWYCYILHIFAACK